MYIIQNAVKNIARNKGRNILIGAITLVIIIAVAVSLIINNTSGAIINNYKSQFGSKVSIAPNLEKVTKQEPKQIERLTTKQYMDFAKSEYLKQSMFSAEIPTISDKIKAVDQDESSKQGEQGPQIIGNGEKNSKMPTIKVLGNSTTDNLTEFAEGQRKLTEGKLYNALNECIISKELAELNKIKVGDKIIVKSAIGESIKIELTVTGIYSDSTPEYGGMPGKMSFMNRRNEILTSFDTVMNNSEKMKDVVNVQATYYLKDPDLLSKFETELRAKGLPDIYSVSTDAESYDRIVGPVDAMKGIFLTFMVVVLILGTIILILLSSMAIRERKYEVGVLRAMGMKKGKVALGLISEVLIITVVCLGVGLGVGRVLSQPAASVILNGQIKAAEEAKTLDGSKKFNIVVAGQNMENENVKPISKIDVGLGLDTLGEISLIALLLAAASSVVSIRKITKYEPIKILMERN